MNPSLTDARALSGMPVFNKARGRDFPGAV